MERFRRGRDFSVWLDLEPRQQTTEGKPRLGWISKMGQRDLRRLLITDAMAVVQDAIRCSEMADPRLARVLGRKLRALVATVGSQNGEVGLGCSSSASHSAQARLTTGCGKL